MSDRGDPDALGQLYNVSIEAHGCACRGFFGGVGGRVCNPAGRYRLEMRSSCGVVDSRLRGNDEVSSCRKQVGRSCARAAPTLRK